MKKISIFGTNGMLGNAVLQIFKEDKFNIIEINRNTIDASTAEVDKIIKTIDSSDYIINCVGLIKSYINDSNPSDVEQAININSIFPYKLSQTGVKVIQVATDCVFDGQRGGYNESDKHNALDVYGKTKSLGEINSNNFLNLRCSIIGLEKKNKKSLLEWFINQEKYANVNGFKNHYWNGITTYAFAKICKGIINNNLWFPGLQHIVPSNSLCKADMLNVFSDVFTRQDIKINKINAEVGINRTLTTTNINKNKQLWQAGNYSEIPTIEEMIIDIKNYS